MTYRITRVKCPECKGTGKVCLCCRGDKKVTAERLRGRADLLDVIGDGGYIAGDLDVGGMLRYRDEAQSLRDWADGMGDVRDDQMGNNAVGGKT